MFVQEISCVKHRRVPEHDHVPLALHVHCDEPPPTYPELESHTAAQTVDAALLLPQPESMAPVIGIVELQVMAVAQEDPVHPVAHEQVFGPMHVPPLLQPEAHTGRQSRVADH